MMGTASERATLKKTGWFLLGMSVLVLASLSPVPVQVWAWNGDHFQPESFPSSVQLRQPLVAGDLEGDGGREQLVLASGVLTIFRGRQVVWRSPQGWEVDQAAITDLDHDSKPEVTLLVWRKFAPWPIDRYIPAPGRIATFHDQDNRSCHLILIGWRGGAMREVWAGSALAEPVRWFQVIAPPPGESNQVGKQILVTLDSLYASPPASPALTLSAWEWNGFGFSLLSRQVGSFSQAVILSSDQAPASLAYILTSRR